MICLPHVVTVDPINTPLPPVGQNMKYDYQHKVTINLWLKTVNTVADPDSIISGWGWGQRITLERTNFKGAWAPALD